MEIFAILSSCPVCPDTRGIDMDALFGSECLMSDPCASIVFLINVPGRWRVASLVMILPSAGKLFGSCCHSIMISRWLVSEVSELLLKIWGKSTILLVLE